MELLSTHPIKTTDLGFHGNLFGGNVLAWMEPVRWGMRCASAASPGC
jgi:acyl-CoA hydrolase